VSLSVLVAIDCQSMLMSNFVFKFEQRTACRRAWAYQRSTKAEKEKSDVTEGKHFCFFLYQGKMSGFVKDQIEIYVHIPATNNQQVKETSLGTRVG
jgi:hypothetical protein